MITSACQKLSRTFLSTNARLGLALALVTFSATPPTHAATFWWNTTTTGLWSSGGNWSSAASGGTSGTAPASSVLTDDVVFNQSSVNGNETIQLDAARSIRGMTFNNTGSTLLQASAPGTQTLTLGTGGITLGAGAGAVTIGNATNAVPLTMGGVQTWTNNSASLLTIVNNVTNGGNLLTVTGTGTGGTQIQGIIAGAGGLTKSGSGTLTLTGSNTFSGATTISSGTLSIAGAGMLANTTYASTVPAFSAAISNAGVFVYSSSASQALAGIISGTGSLTMAGSGMLTLTANNSYTGNTTISSGTLALGPINTGNTSGGRLGGGTYAGAITNNGVLLLNTTANQTFSGVISGSGSIIKTGAFNNQSVYSTLVLTGSSTFSGSVAIQSGTVQLNFAGTGAPASNILSPSSSVVMGVNVGTATPAVSAYGGATVGGAAVLVRPQPTTSFTVTGSTGLSNSQTIAGLTVNDGIAQVAVTASAASSMSLSVGNLQRSAGSRGIVNFTPSATGTATLLTTSTNTNGIVGPWALVTTSAGAKIDWATSAASSGSSGALTPLSGYTTNTWSAGANTNVTGNGTVPVNSETYSLRFGAASTLTLSGTNTISSGGILFGGSYQNSITGGVLRGSATDGLLIVGSGASSNQVISSAITDNGSATGLTYAGFNATASTGLQLSGNNTYTGKTLLLGRTVALASVETGTSGPLGVGGAIEFFGGSIAYDTPQNTTDYSGRFTTAANQSYTVTVPQYSQVTYASSFGSTTGSLSATTRGNLTLTGSNNFPSGVVITGPTGDSRSARGYFGSLTLGSPDALGSVGSVIVEANTNGNVLNLSKLRYTAASAGLDLGSRLAPITNTSSVAVDTNGQDVSFATNLDVASVGSAGFFGKIGFGQLTLSGSVKAARLIMAGGTLTLNSQNNATMLSNGSDGLTTVTGYGGSTFQYTGASGNARSQRLAGVTLQSGLLTLAVNNAGTSTTLDLSGTGTSLVTRATAAIGSVPGFAGTVDFRATGGTFGTTAIVKTGTAQTLTNGIMGPWATVNGTDWATQISGTIQAYAGYTDVADSSIADSGTSNARIATTTGNVTLGAATTTVNTLLQAASTAATISNAAQTLRTGGVMIGNGAAALTIGDSAGSGTLTSNLSGGELVLNNFSTGTLTINSVIANNTSASPLTVSGNGTVVLTAANTLTGTTQVQGGTLQIGNGGTTGSLNSPNILVAPGGTLVFNRTDDYGGTFTKGIVGSPWGDDYAGGIIVRAGNLTLTPAYTIGSTQQNTYSGFTQLLGGTVTVGNTLALSSAGDITFGGGVLRYATGITADFSPRIALSTSAIAIDTNNVAQTWNYSLAASNVAGLTKSGSGTLTLANSNAYLGTTTIAGGGITLGSYGALPTTSAVNITGTAGNLDVSGIAASSLSIGSLSGTTGASVTLGVKTLVSGSDNGSGIFAGSITGAGGGLTKLGAGTLALSGSNGYTGVTSLNGGFLAVNHTNALAGSGTIQFGGGSLQYSSNNTVDYSAKIRNSGSAIAIDTNGQGVTFASAIGNSNTGGLSKLGSGTLTLSGSSSYSGGTTVEAGSLAVNGQIGGNAAVLSNATLGGSGSIAGVLSGAGLVSPGNSPGILTAGQFDPIGGLDAAFEFTDLSPVYTSSTASVNDVLRLTNVSPFTGALTSGNVIDVYFNIDSVAAGSVYEGGFFTTQSAGDLLTALQSANFQYWGKDAGGTTVFNGVNYTALAGVTLQTGSVSRDFGAGSVAGSVTQFVIVPEPGAIALAGIGAVVVGWTAMTAMRHRRRSGRAAA